MATNKRVRNKQTNKQTTAYLEKKGVSQEQLKNLTNKQKQKKAASYKAAETRNKLKQERIQSWRDFGVPDFIIQRDKLYLKANDNLTQKQRSEIKRKALKEEQLQKAGYQYTQSDLKKGWGKLLEQFPGITPPDDYKPRGTSGNKPINENLNITFTAKEYLYVGYADETGKAFDRYAFYHFSRDELRDVIKTRLYEAKHIPDDSGSFAGVFVVLKGTLEDMEREAKIYYTRGYDLTAGRAKLDPKQYSKVTIENRWNEHDFLELLCLCIHHTSNELVGPIWREFRRYNNENNLPFLKDMPPTNYFKH